MEQLRQKIKWKYEGMLKERNENPRSSNPEAKLLFVLPIGAVDTTPYHDTEERIRKKVGEPVPKEVAKSHGLECSTEWVLTTQDYIDKIMEKKQNFPQSPGKDLIDMFTDLKEGDTPTPSKKYKDMWLRAPTVASRK